MKKKQKKQKKQNIDSQKVILDEILNNSVVVQSDITRDTLGKDLQEIVKEMTSEKNRFLLGHSLNNFIFEDSMLSAYADSIAESDDPEMQQLYLFITRFRLAYHTGRSSLKGRMADIFKEVTSSLMGFRGAIEWREAGVRDIDRAQEKRNIIDRIRK